MKKKILSGIFALALLATAGFGVNKSMKSDANVQMDVMIMVQVVIVTVGILHIKKPAITSYLIFYIVYFSK